MQSLTPRRYGSDLLLDRTRLVDKRNPGGEMTGGGDGTIDHHRGGVIAAHRVNRDANQLFLVDRPDLPLPVVAAVRAHAMRCLRFMALRAEAGRGRAERVMCPPLGRPGLGVSTFWIWHVLRLLGYCEAP